MSIEIMALVFKTKLSPTKKLVMLELSDHANDKGCGVWPGVAYVVYRTSLSENTVRDTLKELTGDGLLVTVQAPTATTSAVREINLEKLRGMAEEGENDYLGKKKGQREARDPVPTTGTGVPTTGTPSTNHWYPQYQPLVPPVPATAPESLINLKLNVSETGEGPQKLTPSQLWEHIDQQLRGEIGSNDYLTWVRPLSARCFQNDRLLVEAINTYGRDWCQSRLAKKVSSLATAIAGRPLEVQFCLRSDQ
jgi:hypothetical protein